MRKNKKIAISNEFLRTNGIARKKHLLRAAVFFAIAISLVIFGILFSPPRSFMSVFAGISILILSYNLILFAVLKTKPLFYTNTSDKLSITDIHKSIASLGRVLFRENDKTIVKTTLLNSKIIIGCFDVSDDNAFPDFINDILLVRKMEKQRRNIGYVIIFNIKSSTFDIRKFMKQQTLDNYALCDLRCFYFAEDQELITVYDKKSEFCKQVTEQLVRLLNSLETVGVIGDKDNQQ